YEELADALLASCRAIRDPFWRMPCSPPYDSMLKSSVADVSHIPAGGFGCRVIAALFLKRFVRDSKRFVHLDIFGWVPREQPGRPQGGEPQGARALYHYFRQELGQS